MPMTPTPPVTAAPQRAVNEGGARKTVYVVYTGGTIGMIGAAGGATGYRPVPGDLEARLAALPELSAPEMPRVVFRELSPLLDSAELTPHDWERIGRDLEVHYPHVDGFVVLHGTDTMAYTASALSFMLEGLAKPVILTGSQLPFAHLRSDARDNLITAILLAAHTPLCEVGIYFRGVLLRGNRARKVSSSGFGAFASPNAPPLATVGVEVELQPAARRTPYLAGPLRLQALADVQVGALRLFPGIDHRFLDNVLQRPLQGLVLETYDSGNAPRDPNFLRVLARATERGVVVVNCTQCFSGKVDMTSYATGQVLRDAGLTGGADLTPEAALTKLVYLFSKGYTPDEVRALVTTDLRGELTPEAT
jgi:L-asparaginase